MSKWRFPNTFLEKYHWVCLRDKNMPVAADKTAATPARILPKRESFHLCASNKNQMTRSSKQVDYRCCIKLNEYLMQ